MASVGAVRRCAFLTPLLLAVKKLVVKTVLGSLLGRDHLPCAIKLFTVKVVLKIVGHANIFRSLPRLRSTIDSITGVGPSLVLCLFLPVLVFSTTCRLGLRVFGGALTGTALLTTPKLVVYVLLANTLVVKMTAFVPNFRS